VFQYWKNKLVKAAVIYSTVGKPVETLNPANKSSFKKLIDLLFTLSALAHTLAVCPESLADFDEMN
jgi:hypothetical protein